MSGKRKLLILVSLLGVVALISISVFSACDNRKAINPSVDIVSAITLSVSPEEMVLYSSENPDTAEINIWVTGEGGEGLDSVQITLSIDVQAGNPQIAAIVSPPLTTEGFAQGLLIVNPQIDADTSIVITATASNISVKDTVAISKDIRLLSMSFDPPELVVHSSEQEDTVEINIWVRDEEGSGIDSVNVAVTRSVEFGTLIQPGLTQDGFTQALFITDLGIDYDTTIAFTAHSFNVTYTDSLNIVHPSQALSMHFSPPELIIYSSEDPDTVEIDIWARDLDGSGIEGVQVQISRFPDIGTITQPPATVNGYTQCIFVVEPGIEVDTTIIFSATTANASCTDTLNVLYSSHMISMSFNPPQLVIYSPNKSDTVAVDIWVRNENGSGVDSVEVYVSRAPEIGSIVPPPFTSNGYTQALFITDPGNYDESFVIFTAQTGSASDIDTLTITPSLQGEIDHMNISLQKLRLTANGVDQTNIYVSVIDTTGVPIGDGTIVFISNYGSTNPGTLNLTNNTTENGIASFTLTAPPILDTLLITEVDTLRAWATSLSGDTTFAYATIIYEPDSPSQLLITTIPEPLIAGSGECDSIWVTVSDAYGSFVMDGTQVQFKKDLPTSDITTLTTTTGGKALGIYTVGTEAGLDIIKAFIASVGSNDTLWSNAVPLEVRSSAPSNIALSTNDATIEVGGIGTMIYATMQDENGNALSDGYGVRFEITAPTVSGVQSPSFTYVATPDSVCHVVDSVFTDVNGRASVALFSGTKAGTVRIKATSIDNENIFKEKPIVTIQSGPPYHIEIAYSNVAGVIGEAITTGITAMVWDEFTNPVEPGTAVHFEVIPDTVAYIEGAAYTGGWVDSLGDTIGVRGQASTWMSYPCNHTFDTVWVEASSGDMADTSGVIVLALYDGTIDAWASPGYLYVAAPGFEEADVAAQLLDGLNCRIHNGVINFTVQVCGELVGQVVDTTDDDGMVYTTFRIWDYQIPQTLPDPPQCTAKVNAKLRGYPDVEGEAEIFCSRP